MYKTFLILDAVQPEKRVHAWIIGWLSFMFAILSIIMDFKKFFVLWGRMIILLWNDTIDVSKGYKSGGSYEAGVGEGDGTEYFWSATSESHDHCIKQLNVDDDIDPEVSLDQIVQHDMAIIA